MNPVYELIAAVLDRLTGGSLDYKEPHGAADSRIDAGLRLLENDHVEPYQTLGYYRVYGEDGKTVYHVCAEMGDLSCTCEDATMPAAKNAPPKVGICKHIIAAVVYEAQRYVFAQMDARERGAA